MTGFLCALKITVLDQIMSQNIYMLLLAQLGICSNGVGYPNVFQNPNVFQIFTAV